MRSTEQFQRFYEAELLPHLQQLEGKRQQIVSRLTATGLIVALVAAAAAILGALWARNPIIGLFVLIVGGFVFFVLYWRMTKGFVAEFKQRVIGRIVTFIDANLSYQPGHCISRSAYMGSRIFLTSPHRYQGEDLVRGKIDKTEIQFSELHTQYKTETTDSKGRRQTQWHTIFRGIFFIADFNKHFQGETVVLPDTAEKLFGGFGRQLQSWNLSRSGELVQLEDVEFEQRFVVYSQDQVEARYILSPSLMARIVDFVKRTGQEVYISFVSSHIHVAIAHSKDLFEPKLFSTLLDVKLAQEYVEDLMLVIGIVEDLNLNTRIWTKQ